MGLGYVHMRESSKSRIVPGFQLKCLGESCCCSVRWGRWARHRPSWSGPFCSLPASNPWKRISAPPFASFPWVTEDWNNRGQNTSAAGPRPCLSHHLEGSEASLQDLLRSSPSALRTPASCFADGKAEPWRRRATRAGLGLYLGWSGSKPQFPL